MKPEYVAQAKSPLDKRGGKPNQISEADCKSARFGGEVQVLAPSPASHSYRVANASETPMQEIQRLGQEFDNHADSVKVTSGYVKSATPNEVLAKKADREFRALEKKRPAAKIMQGLNEALAHAKGEKLSRNEYMKLYMRKRRAAAKAEK